MTWFTLLSPYHINSPSTRSAHPFSNGAPIFPALLAQPAWAIYDLSFMLATPFTITSCAQWSLCFRIQPVREQGRVKALMLTQLRGDSKTLNNIMCCTIGSFWQSLFRGYAPLIRLGGSRPPLSLPSEPFDHVMQWAVVQLLATIVKARIQRSILANHFGLKWKWTMLSGGVDV